MLCCRLQCSLSDFRRLCILKGIFPRVPKSAKRANKGSTAPASFYYAKDIQYLLHEPVLGKLREHKTFAKKLSRAVGRGEWALAKGLEERRPVYKLDHILKERCVGRCGLVVERAEQLMHASFVALQVPDVPDRCP